MRSAICAAREAACYRNRCGVHVAITNKLAPAKVGRGRLFIVALHAWLLHILFGRRGAAVGRDDFLQLDHVLPWAAGGESTLENLRLRSSAHNRQAARHHFGEGFVNAAIARARVKQEPGKQEPGQI